MANAVSNWVLLAINVSIGFLLTPVIISHIGKDGYGLWMLVSSLVCYYGLLRMGVGTAIMRYISLNDGRKDRAAVDGTFSAAMLIYVAVAVVLILISFLAAKSLASFFEQGRDFEMLLKFLGISAALNCPSAVLEATLRSREKFVAANNVMAVISIIRGVGLASVLYLGKKLGAMGAISLCSSALELIIMWWVFKLCCKDIHLRLSQININYVKYLLSFGSMVTLVSIGIMLRFQSDRVIIGKILSLEILGIYSVIATLLVNFRNLMRATTRVLNPRFSFLDGTGDFDTSTDLFLRSSKMAAVLSAGICLLLMLGGPGFIKLWVGPGFEAGYPILLILSIAYMVGQSQTVSAVMLTGYGKQLALALQTITEGLMSIILAVILGIKYGLIGVAIGTAIPMIIVQGIVLPIYMCHFLRISISSYYGQCLAIPWLLTLIVFGMVHGFGMPVEVDSWIGLIALCSFVGLVFGFFEL